MKEYLGKTSASIVQLQNQPEELKGSGIPSVLVLGQHSDTTRAGAPHSCLLPSAEGGKGRAQASPGARGGWCTLEQIGKMSKK